jgi:hypothetical protein
MEQNCKLPQSGHRIAAHSGGRRAADFQTRLGAGSLACGAKVDLI